MSGSAWKSTRVHGKTGGAAAGPTNEAQHAPKLGTADAKIEDVARLREQARQATAGISNSANKGFEAQETVDALSNLCHVVEDVKMVELAGPPIAEPHQTCAEFNERFLKKINGGS
ncbi:hypothetical protein AGDE_03360 [Angomonas deanei]|uniref:Uncharacterized protein n=1 Tax=Angomonas deanei TaxID=59799 RepID=A0A7G2CER3_9TRYP|nr:hypothetical protein AGDE_03360 [Angomonas deanei]CAD2218398.1 hypothetical protein, conserved [Angomonas deanei]|eukprot:EPY40568.1 hypothetical protein AGDE_03360 [Angomonas deanei]